jgi:hypothetical protein
MVAEGCKKAGRAKLYLGIQIVLYYTSYQINIAFECSPKYKGAIFENINLRDLTIILRFIQ